MAIMPFAGGRALVDPVVTGAAFETDNISASQALLRWCLQVRMTIRCLGAYHCRCCDAVHTPGIT